MNVISAVLVSLLMPGLGHFSCGKIKRGLIFYASGLASGAVGLAIGLQPIPPFNIILGILCGLGMYCASAFDAARFCQDEPDAAMERKLIIYVVLVVLLAVNSSIVRPFLSEVTKRHLGTYYRVASAAMTPSLLEGEYVLVQSCGTREPGCQTGDIIVVTYPDEGSRPRIRRVVGRQGDLIELKDGHLYVNKQRYGQGRFLGVLPAVAMGVDAQGPGESADRIVVPRGSLFVAADNTAYTSQNGLWALVNQGDIKGRVINVYWSRDKEGARIRWHRIGKVVT